MRNVIIIGNSGAARECYALFLLVPLVNPTCLTMFRFKGFLSHKSHAGDLRELTHLQLGSDTNYAPQPGDAFIIGIAEPALRQECYLEMKARGGDFFNLISPWAGVQADTVLGEGNVIGHSCIFSCNVRLGNANYLNGGVRLGHDVTVGDYNFWGPDSMALGSATVGSGNRIGVRSVLLEKSRVGNGNNIAPGSFIYKGCRNNARMAGNPALKIGDMTTDATPC